MRTLLSNFCVFMILLAMATSGCICAPRAPVASTEGHEPSEKPFLFPIYVDKMDFHSPRVTRVIATNHREIVLAVARSSTHDVAFGVSISADANSSTLRISGPLVPVAAFCELFAKLDCYYGGSRTVVVRWGDPAAVARSLNDAFLVRDAADVPFGGGFLAVPQTASVLVFTGFGFVSDAMKVSDAAGEGAELIPLPDPRPTIFPSFEEVSLGQLIDYWRRTNRFHVFVDLGSDDALQQKVTIQSNHELTDRTKSYWLDDVLVPMGLLLYPPGKYGAGWDYVFVVRSDYSGKGTKVYFPQLRLGTDPDGVSLDDDLITQLIPLSRLSVVSDADAIRDVLKSGIGSEMDVDFRRTSNSVMVTGTSAKIREVVKLVSRLDSAAEPAR